MIRRHSTRDLPQPRKPIVIFSDAAAEKIDFDHVRTL
jgi:hypothetical protein